LAVKAGGSGQLTHASGQLLVEVLFAFEILGKEIGQEDSGDPEIRFGQAFQRSPG